MADSIQPPINTLRSTKTSYILQTFWNIFPEKNVIFRLKLLLSWFFGVQFAILCHWFRHKGFDERTWFRWHHYHIIFVYLQLIDLQLIYFRMCNISTMLLESESSTIVNPGFGISTRFQNVLIKVVDEYSTSLCQRYRLQNDTHETPYHDSAISNATLTNGRFEMNAPFQCIFTKTL